MLFVLCAGAVDEKPLRNMKPAKKHVEGKEIEDYEKLGIWNWEL